MAKTSILTILIQLAKQGNADRETIKGLAQLKSQVGLTMGAFGALAGVGYTLNKVYQNTTQVFMDYAMQVKATQRLTGENAQETSRLIQMADDAAISYESLQKALWFASKSGVEVNIDSIARLSDEYVALAGPTEKAEFLAKNFGKGGAEMGKLLEKGADGVRKMTAAIGENLILSDAQVQQAEETRLALDELSDTVQGLKVAAGSDIAGPLTASLQSLNEQIREEGILGIGTADILQMLWAAIQKGGDEADSATQSYTAWAFAMRDTNTAMEDQAVLAEEMSRANTDMLSLIMNLQSEDDRYSESLGELTTKISDLRTEQGLYTEGSAKYKDLQTEIEKTAEAISALALEHEMAGKRIAFSLIQQKMAVDGLSDAEFESLLDIGQAWGILDETTVVAAKNMNKEANVLANGGLKNVRSRMKEIIDRAERLFELSGSSFDFFVNIFTRGAFPKIGKNLPAWAGDIGLGGDAPVNIKPDESRPSGSAFARGGQLGRGWAMVGEQGFEIISPSGFVIPHDIASQMIAGGLIPDMEMATGGQMQWSEPPEPVKQISSKSLSLARSSPRIGSSRSGSGGISAPQSQASTTAVVTEAVQPLAESTSLAVHNAQVTQQVTVTALQGLTTAQSEANNLMAGIRDDLKRNNATIQASMIAAVEQMRG